MAYAAYMVGMVPMANRWHIHGLYGQHDCMDPAQSPGRQGQGHAAIQAPQNIKEEPMRYITGNKNIDLFEQLIEEPSLTVTHLVFAAGQEAPEHWVDFDVVVVPTKGRVEFIDTQDGSSQVIQPGMLIRMSPGEHHAMRALEPSEFMVVKMRLEGQKG